MVCESLWLGEARAVGAACLVGVYEYLLYTAGVVWVQERRRCLGLEQARRSAGEELWEGAAPRLETHRGALSGSPRRCVCQGSATSLSAESLSEIRNRL